MVAAMEAGRKMHCQARRSRLFCLEGDAGALWSFGGCCPFRWLGPQAAKLKAHALFCVPQVLAHENELHVKMGEQWANIALRDALTAGAQNNLAANAERQAGQCSSCNASDGCVSLCSLSHIWACAIDPTAHIFMRAPPEPHFSVPSEIP